jgi:hypothetical protein
MLLTHLLRKDTWVKPSQLFPCPLPLNTLTLYTNTCVILTHHHTHIPHPSLASSNGVRQGDVLASIAFAITVQPIFQACLQRKANGFAIIDDFTITGPLHDVAASYTELKLRCDRINFKVNTKKTFIYIPEPNDIPADFTQWADKQQLEIKHHATSLGTIITRDHQKTAKFLAKKLAEIE